MSKERLEDMENNAMFDGTIRYVDGERIVDNYARIRQEDYEWLIEQAERAQAQEFYKKDWMLVVEQNKRLREALEEIKKEETVTTALSEGQVAYTFSGHIARKALEVKP